MKKERRPRSFAQGKTETFNDLARMRRELADLRREVGYLRTNAEQVAGRMLLMDMDSISIRQELEQKRRGFSLMADLAVTMGQKADYEGVLVSVSKRLNSTLNMQRTAVLVPDANGTFRATVLQGYPPEEKNQIISRSLELPPEILDPLVPVLVTGEDSPTRLAALREALALPYFISSPVMLHGEVVAVLVTGRLVEQQPFLLRLGHSDTESVRTVSSYMAAVLTSRRLAEAETMANRDPLTHLPNLRQVRVGLRQVLTLAKRSAMPVAVMFIDLDGFKDVNDKYGHAVGDVVLRVVADRLAGSVRESDLVGRIGGDEFLVVLSRITKAEDAGLVAGKIIDKLTCPVEIAGNSCRVGASIGIAVFPQHGHNESSLIKAADEAMYVVKSRGKNAYRYAETVSRTNQL